MKNILILMVWVLPALTYAQGDKNFIDQNYIEVNGKSEMEIIPDMIYLRILISEKDSKNKTSIVDTEKQMITKLESIGIDIKKDLTIIDLVSNFKFSLLAKTDVILAKEYQLLVHDGKTASKVYIELEKIGVSNVSVEKLDHSKMEEFRKEVKVSSIKAAKEKAEALTKAINQSIGRAIYIQEFDPIPYDNRTSNIRLRGISSLYGNSSPPKELEIDFEKLKLEYSILVRFELK